MSTNEMSMELAGSRTFQGRVRLELARAAMVAMGQENSARLAYAKKVLRGEADFYAASVAVLTNPSIQASVAANPATAEAAVLDSDVAFVVSPGGVPANGLFATLAEAAAD